jgi:hypothetical protein
MAANVLRASKDPYRHSENFLALDGSVMYSTANPKTDVMKVASATIRSSNHGRANDSPMAGCLGNAFPGEYREIENRNKII